ncbi:hypothetical protein TRFO_43303 [Tritrichomonas foetus]|uniref:Tc1-like transposase DDE domain-containing protein n=1 Tax=Tritrichomonas foetus TaxID=1144522 RepID=A0A1J4KR99_9EUKA|nr:hypothetical protein TRFO_43303 [Tritrichomonas foetus]|eukprot:OHT13618.1 hypothetical protein TRFO_43303 [Tritrichomonas foetus]
MVNSPLSKAKVSILALVIPCFGVIYKYIEKSVLGDHYSDFLKECTDFLRRFIVDNTTEIVIIEDNCQIHKTSEVENTISTLQICVLPIVPYSPALNSVVEGYFGIMKGNQINSSYQEQHEKHLFVYQIEKQWNKTTKLLFTIEKQEKLYAEWLTRLHACIQGKPLFTGHVNRDTTDSYLEKLRSFKTYRSLSIINSDSQQEGS